MKNLPLWILVGLVAIITLVEIGGFREKRQPHEMMEQKYDQDSALREHCREMPEMQGCEKFNNEAPAMGGMNHSMMDHGSMVTSEEGFVVNMIPHHQEAVDTARLVVAKGEIAELKKLAKTAEKVWIATDEDRE